MQDHEQTSHAAAEAFLAGADLDDFLFVLLDSLHPSFPGDTAAVSAAGVAPSELTEDAGATGQCHTQASASEGPPLLAVLRESWRPAKLLYDILEPPDGEAATAVAKAESEHQQQQKGEVEDLALRNLEVELSCPVAWGVSAEFLAEKPVYASCLSAGASLLSYAESEPERVLLAIKAFLEVHPAAKDHQVALLLLLRLLVFRWALYHHLKLHKRVEYSLKRPSVDAGETPGLFDYADAASNASEKPVTGTATSDLATPVAGCLSAIIAFAIQEASALADGDERKELLVEVLQILACCVPHIVISKLLKAVKKAGQRGPLHVLLFASLVRLVAQFCHLLVAVLLPLQPEEPALALQQQQKSLSLPIRWSISLRAAEALSAFASVAAIGNCRSLLMTLEPQRQDTKSDNEPKAVELQSAQEDGSPATDEGDVHQGAAAYRQRLLLHEKTVATQQLEETVYRGDNHTGSVNNSDTGFGDGVKLEGPRAAAFFTHVATSLSHLAEVLSEGEYHWRIAQRAAEMQTVLLLLLLHTSRRCLTPRDPLRDSLADETLKTLVLPIVAAAVSSLSAVQMQHDAKTSELPAAANGRNALMQPCHPALARLTAAPPYLQEVGWVVHAVNKAASTGDPMHGLHASVCWCFPSSSPVDSLMKSSSGTLADKFSNMQLMLRAARQQAQPLTDADTVRFVTDGIARLLGSPVRCRGGLAMAALHATTDALAAAGSALHRLRVQRIEPQQQQQLMAIQCAALVFIGRTAETQRIDCPPPQLALSPWQLPSRPCHCVPQGEPVVSLRLPQSGEVQQQRESVDSQLEDAQYQVAERRRMRCETAARLVTSIFTLANRRCLSPAQAAALLSVCRSLAESRLLQAAALFLAVEAEEQQPAPRPSESASTSQQQQQETNGSSSALSTDTEVQAHIDFKLPLLRPAEAALGWSTVRLIEPNDSSSTSDEELFPTRRLPSLRRRRQMIKRDAPSVPPTSNPLGLNASEVDSTSFSTGGTGSGTAAEEKQRAATLQQMPRATTAAATGGAAWTEHPPVAVCGIFMFVLRLLCIAPADGEGDAAADFTHWTMRETLQLEVKPTELPRAASPAAILRDAATHVLFDAFACKTPDLLFPVLLECLSAGLVLRPAMPAVCSCLALLVEQSEERSFRSFLAAAHGSAAPSEIYHHCHRDSRSSATFPSHVSPAVPQSQAGALCQLLLHAADIHSEGGALAIAALNAISKLIRSVLPSNMMQQQQDAFVSEGSMLNMETSLEPSYADKAELFVSFLVKSLKEHADGAFTLFSEGWVGALCELLLLLHRGLLSVYGGSETQQLFVSCCLLRSFAAAAAAVQKEAEITGNGDLQKNLVRVLLGCGSAAAEAQVDGLSEEAEGPPALWLLLSSTSEASVRGVRAGPGIIESLLMLSKAPGERERLADLPGGSSSSSVEGDWPEGVEAVSGSAQLPAAAAAVEQRATARAVALAAGSSTSNFASALSLLQSLGTPPMQRRPFSGFPFFGSSGSKQQAEGGRVLLLLARPLGTWLFGGSSGSLAASYGGLMQQAKDSMLGVFYNEADAVQLIEKTEAFLAAAEATTSAAATHQKPCAFFLFVSLMLSLVLALQKETDRALALTLAAALHSMAEDHSRRDISMRAASVYDSPALLMLSTQWVEAHCGISLRCSSRVVEAAEETVASAGAAAQSSGSKSLSSEYPHRGGTRWGVEGQAELLQGPPLLPRIFRENLDGTSSSRKDGGDVDASTSQEELLQAAAVIGSAIGRGVELAICALLPYCLHCRSLTAMPVSSLKATSAQLKEAASAWETGASLILPGPLSAVEAALGLTNGSRAAVIGSLPTGESKLRPLSVAAFNCIAEMLPVRLQTSDRHREQHDLLLQLERVSGEELQIHKGLCCMVLVASLHVLRNQVPAATTAYARTVYVRAISAAQTLARAPTRRHFYSLPSGFSGNLEASSESQERKASDASGSFLGERTKQLPHHRGEGQQQQTSGVSAAALAAGDSQEPLESLRSLRVSSFPGSSSAGTGARTDVQQLLVDTKNAVQDGLVLELCLDTLSAADKEFEALATSATEALLALSRHSSSWQTTALLLQGGDSCLQLSVLAMQSFDLLVAKAARGTAAARVVADATTDVSAPAASANTISQGGSLLLEQHEPLFEKPSILTDAKGTSSNSQRRLQSQDFGRVAEVRRLLYPGGMQDKLLAESEGPAALVSMRCLTELLCPLPHAVAANTHLHQQAQTQGDDKQDPPLQHSQASLELERSSSSSNILHRPAIIRRVSRAFFAVFPIRRTRARWASRETKQGSMQDNEKETDGSSQADAGSDFCVAALEYEAQTFWTQRLQQEEAQLEESAAECLFRLALLDFDAVLSPLTAYTQPSSADLSKMSSASAGPAASSLISPAPSPVSTGFREGEESFVSAGGMAVQRDATAVWNLKGLTASLLSLEQFEDMAAVIQWRGSCCFYSTNCIHRLFASCISRDKSLAAKLISHVTGVCNKLAATAPAAGETGALAAEDQRALRHTAPLLGTALLRLGMAHAATSLSGSQQQQRLSPHAESARLQILGSNDELISWDSLKAQVEGSAASSSKENISPRKATQLISSPVAAAAELLVALADVTGLRQALKALDGCNFLARATNPSDCIGAIHDATLLFGATQPSLLPALIPFLAPFCGHPLLGYRSSAIAAMQGAAAALHVVNLVPSAGLTDARATGNESVSSKQQQQQQPRSPEYTADARVAANAGTSMPHRHPKQHFCGTWTAFVPSKAFPDITTNGLLAAGARVQSASASRSPCTGQGMLLLPAKSMERLLETATDAAVDAAAMTLDDIQPHLLRLEVLVSTGKTAPPDASAAAEAVSESLLAADALHSLRSALACLQILTHLWVGLHRTAAEGGFSPAAAAACADAAAQDAENAQGTALPHASHAFGNESRALRVLEVFEVGFAVYPTLRCRPTGRQAHGGEDASREREGATGVAAAIAATAASAAFEATLQCIVHCAALPRCAWPSEAAEAAALSLIRRRLLQPSSFLPFAAISETPLLPLLFRALKHSAMLLQQAHGEEEPAAAATDPGKLCDTHFLKPREADELAFAALFHCGTTNPAVTQAAAECLLTLLPMLGLPKGRTSQRHLQCLQEALKKELEALGLIRPVLRIRANEPQQLPCACCCVLEQQPQEHAQGQYSSLNRKPRAVSGLLSAAECFFYSAALSGTRSESTGTTRIHGGTSLVARSMRLQRLLKPILRALLHADWHANLERTCCLCSLDDPDFFASEVKARGSCEGAQATSGSSGATNTPLDEGDGSRSLGGWNASEGNCGSRTEDPPNLVMHDLCYRACRRLCLRICHLLQCCRYYFPSRCSTVSAPPHPAIVLHKQQASARRKQRRVDWLFFGSLIGKDTQSEAKANDAPRKEGESSWRPPGGRASFSNLPGMNREVALRAIDGVGLIRTVAGFFGHNEEEEPAPEGQPSAEESENSDAESEMRETADVQKWQHMTFFLSNPPGPELPMEAGPINPHQPLQQQQQKKLQLFSESAPTAQKAADAPILSVSLDSVDLEDEVLVQLQQALEYFRSNHQHSWTRSELFLCASVASTCITEALYGLCYRQPLINYLESSPVLVAQGMRVCTYTIEACSGSQGRARLRCCPLDVATVHSKASWSARCSLLVSVACHICLLTGCASPYLAVCRQLCGLLKMRSPLPHVEGNTAGSPRALGSSGRLSSNTAAANMENGASSIRHSTKAEAIELEEERAVASVALMGLRHVGNAPSREQQQQQSEHLHLHSELQPHKDEESGLEQSVTTVPAAPPCAQVVTDDQERNTTQVSSS
ncbi:hypothetical protein cyc_01519 [Cyclospora cayetanensis]|uniref:Uncharacterized protein n=1 Tax=Cyclospora cayetanensis TaxID=88456 RepID=A0A1D3D6Z4_9EIME|nr:hypothetical protein cyc_01519 [Cyclospora cayetanensis]